MDKKEFQSRDKNEVVEVLIKKFYLSITNACIESTPKLENCFEIRKQVINNLKRAVDNE